MNQLTLHTDRLVLRPLHPDDAQDLFALYSNPETMRFDPSSPHLSVSQTHEHITRELSYPGSCYWSLLQQGTQTPVGVVGFLGGTAIPGLGYMLRHDLWRKGLITEACQAAMDYGFSELGYKRVEMWIDPQNLASRRVAEKLGASPRGVIHLKYNYRPDHHLMMVYGITADEWRGEIARENPVRFFRSQPVYFVRSVVDSLAFYKDKLGFEVEFLYREQPDAPPTHASVARGDWTGSRVVIQLSEITSGATREPEGHLYIFVDSRIGELFESLKKNGVEMLSPLQNYAWGMREFTIQDPDGHRIRFGSSG